MTSVHETSSEAERAQTLVSLIDRRGAEMVESWVRLQTAGNSGKVSDADADDLADQSRSVLSALRDGVHRAARVDDPTGPEFEPVRRLISEISRREARQGANPTGTAHGVLALREAIVFALQTEQGEPSEIASATVTAGRLVDALAVLTFETFVRGREEIISRQSQELLELSTPVVQLWDGVVGVPLVGTLDSARAQIAMETLLQAIVDEHANVAILDITGVPTVDTLVAQHLLKTVTATRLMGADCIISGIRPQTAQTIVQLGIDLTDITTCATLADALRTAIHRAGGVNGFAQTAERG